MMNKAIYKIWAIDESNYKELWGMWDNAFEAEEALKDWSKKYKEYKFIYKICLR